jgi:cardiolipin synthase
MPPLWVLLLGMNYALALVCVVRVLRSQREPPSMVIWVVTLLTLPGVGLIVYYLLGSSRLRRKARRRRRRVAHLIRSFQEMTEQRGLPHAAQHGSALPADLAHIERLGRTLGDMPATAGNEVRILQDAEETYAVLEEAIRAARHHVHLLYYIWQPDETGHYFRDLLIARAREGLECRLLLDSVGSHRLGARFLRPLTEAGVRVAFFMPLHLYPLRRRWSLHLRNHRKLAVIDGHVGFTGSQNIGDEYRGRRADLSPWYDTQVRLTGPAALFLQETFAEDWFLATREALAGPAYFPPPPQPGNSFVQILPTGPYEVASVLAHVIFAAVSSAHTSIRIATPYFVPDLPMRMALLHACYRHVPVRLVLPSRSDATLALWAARSFYAELLAAGVEIHEYEQGMLHSKIVTVDDRWCMVGSANMDARSFRLNFEITALIYDAAVAGALAQTVDGFCAQARRITARAAHRLPWRQQVAEGTARLFAPLL